MIPVIFCLILQCVFGGGTLLKMWDSASVERQIITGDCEISGDDLNGETVGLFVDKYSPMDEQITRICDMPDLKNIWMYSIGQEMILTLENLPKIIEIDISKNALTYISKKMFSKVPVKSIWLYLNQISIIEDGAFGPDVTLVSLYCNNLETVRSKWFKDPSKITWFELHGNQIKTLSKNLFKPFTALKDINLAMNQIHTIHPGAFSGVRSFNELFLAYNHLRTLDASMFKDGIITIKNFDIRYNNLTDLPKELLDRLDVPTTTLIDGNPWECNCYNKVLMKWINMSTYGQSDYFPKYRDGEPRCVASIEMIGKDCGADFDRQKIIDIYAGAALDAPNSREKYCPCRMEKKQWVDCFHKLAQ